MSDFNHIQVQTVTGVQTYDHPIIADAHNHVWISQGLSPLLNAPALHDFDKSLSELQAYKLSGGQVILDCQPVGCGRDGNKLFQLSESSGVSIICCTGFHRKIYYPNDSQFWKLSTEELTKIFITEIQEQIIESEQSQNAIKAGFIKVAAESTLEKTPKFMLEAAANAAIQTKSAIEIHTEKGGDAESIIRYFTDKGVAANKLVLCHIDKRTDLGLHIEFAQEEVLLEYDTFFRSKYDPENNVWPLLLKMVNLGFDNQICLATDFAESEYWISYGGSPGLAALATHIKPRLQEFNFPTETIANLLGNNILTRIALSNHT